MSLYQQFAGRYDFTFVGNTLNPFPNSSYYPTYILTTSSAELQLNTTDVVEKAYLYWAGSGTGDFDIKLNGIDISAQRTFAASQVQANLSRPFFSGFYDVTDIVLATGNGIYTVSELDLNYLVSTYNPNGTNFAGWAILIVYRNDSLPLNILNIYDGLESLSPPGDGVLDSVTITLDNLNVIDNDGAKIGFIAWEGDANIAIQEKLTINTSVLSTPGLNPGDPPFNPENNAFNGTNSVTGQSNLYNMDLDIYDIEGNIEIGDPTASITMQSAQDYVMIGTIITKLNSQLPDATVSIDNFSQSCNSREIVVEYTVNNVNSTDPLPAGTQIGFYADNELIGTSQTPVILQIGESIVLTQTITVPDGIPLDFTLSVVADYDTAVTELVETNNSDTQPISLWVSPAFNQPEDIVNCNLGLTAAYFDFSAYEQSIPTDSSHLISFHNNQTDAETNSSPIINTMNYYSEVTPKEIFVRIEDENGCVSITSFFLRTRNCPPTIYNAVSSNGDGLNDTFHIDGLYNIFMNFELFVYNRWGRLVWTGNNNTEEWNGYVKEGIGSSNAPDGTYYYVLKLHDKDYPDALTGYLYLNH
ncbi:gliding motility-associated C-terminal domain-containing protein [Flavobacterium sp.]|uniref:T9SS type B sorting domain-containing protein n=1 Tax=Flavobacterium sp. TaxID=239 RepID=UPI0028BD65AA|nr:gliding motility-associated C-terminal domain-containing protein [Flavobacterium sp.]